MSYAEKSRQFLDIYSDVDKSLADICIASFLISHGFERAAVTIGSVGSMPKTEALAFNALLPPDATLVALLGGTRLRNRTYISDVVNEIESSGLPLRLQFADLTSPSRWPQMLAAMATSELGILGIDVLWAVEHPDFWGTLRNFTETRRLLVYFRGMFDYHNPKAALTLIRSMPADYTISLVGTTSHSVWFATDPVHGSITRDLLRSSGLFTDDNQTDADQLEKPVFVNDGRALRYIDSSGYLPRLMISTTNRTTASIEYYEGWSEAEGDGCWTAASDAVLRVALPHSLHTPSAVAITGNAWVSRDIMRQIVSVGIGSDPTSWTDIEFFDPEVIATATLDIRNLPRNLAELMIRIKIDKPGRPSDHGGIDSRLLGFKLRMIAIYA